MGKMLWEAIKSTINSVAKHLRLMWITFRFFPSFSIWVFLLKFLSCKRNWQNASHKKIPAFCCVCYRAFSLYMHRANNVHITWYLKSDFINKQRVYNFQFRSRTYDHLKKATTFFSACESCKKLIPSLFCIFCPRGFSRFRAHGLFVYFLSVWQMKNVLIWKFSFVIFNCCAIYSVLE